MCDKICRNCKHWGIYFDIPSVKKMMTPRNQGGYGWTDEVAAKKQYDECVTGSYTSRAIEKYARGCKVIKEVVEVDIEQGRGWDAGGASVEEINTPGDFGCNKFVNWEEGIDK